MAVQVNHTVILKITFHSCRAVRSVSGTIAGTGYPVGDVGRRIFGAEIRRMLLCIAGGILPWRTGIVIAEDKISCGSLYDFV